MWLTRLEKRKTDYFGRSKLGGLWKKNRYLRILVRLCTIVQNFQNWSEISLILSFWGFTTYSGVQVWKALVIPRLVIWELLHILYFSFDEIEWLILQSLVTWYFFKNVMGPVMSWHLDFNEWDSDRVCSELLYIFC